MSENLSILSSFRNFKDEGNLIGHLLAGYGELEYALCHCVANARSDLDMVFKAMFRARGETQRIDIADAIGRPAYEGLGLGQMFAEAIGGMRYCLKIRNQFAHCKWRDDLTGNLGFADLEELAISNAEVDLAKLKVQYVDIALLTEQMSYFLYVDKCLDYLDYEGRKRARKLPSHIFEAPKKVTRPQLHIPQPEDDDHNFGL